MQHVLIFVFISLLLGGCAGRRLTPAPEADRVVGVDDTARTESNGLSMTVRSNHWQGDPANLREVILPMYVSLRNESVSPVLLVYQKFTVAGNTGYQAAALPPFEINATVPAATVSIAVTPWYGWSSFYLAPYYAPHYRGFYPTWVGHWYYDRPFYAGYTTWRRPLPTTDMLEKALPEGVLQRGGSIAGYLYFSKLPKRIEQITFQANMMDAETDRPVALLTIPFVMQK